jgi:hypothetical protein
VGTGLPEQDHAQIKERWDHDAIQLDRIMIE